MEAIGQEGSWQDGHASLLDSTSIRIKRPALAPAALFDSCEKKVNFLLKRRVVLFDREAVPDASLSEVLNQGFLRVHGIGGDEVARFEIEPASRQKITQSPETK